MLLGGVGWEGAGRYRRVQDGRLVEEGLMEVKEGLWRGRGNDGVKPQARPLAALEPLEWFDLTCAQG